MIGDAVPFRRQHAAERGHRPGDTDARNSSGWESRSSPASKRRLQKITLIVIRSPHTQNDKNFCGGRSMPRLYSGKRVSSCVHTHTNLLYALCSGQESKIRPHNVHRRRADSREVSSAGHMQRASSAADTGSNLIIMRVSPASQHLPCSLAPAHPCLPWNPLIRSWRAPHPPFPSTRRSSPDSPR